MPEMVRPVGRASVDACERDRACVENVLCDNDRGDVVRGRYGGIEEDKDKEGDDIEGERGEWTLPDQNDEHDCGEPMDGSVDRRTVGGFCGRSLMVSVSVLLLALRVSKSVLWTCGCSCL